MHRQWLQISTYTEQDCGNLVDTTFVSLKVAKKVVDRDFLSAGKRE